MVRILREHGQGWVAPSRARVRQLGPKPRLTTPDQSQFQSLKEPVPGHLRGPHLTIRVYSAHQLSPPTNSSDHLLMTPWSESYESMVKAVLCHRGPGFVSWGQSQGQLCPIRANSSLERSQFQASFEGLILPSESSLPTNSHHPPTLL